MEWTQTDQIWQEMFEGPHAFLRVTEYMYSTHRQINQYCILDFDDMSFRWTRQQSKELLGLTTPQAMTVNGFNNIW